MHEVGRVQVLLFGSGVQRCSAASAADGRFEAFWDAARAETCDRMTLFHKFDVRPSSVTYVSGRSFGPKYFKQLRRFCGLTFGAGVLANF